MVRCGCAALGLSVSSVVEIRYSNFHSTWRDGLVSLTQPFCTRFCAMGDLALGQRQKRNTIFSQFVFTLYSKLKNGQKGNHYDTRRYFAGSGRQDDQDRAGGHQRICRRAHRQGVARPGREYHGGGLWLADAHPGTGGHHHAGTAHAGHPAVGHELAAPDREGDSKGEHRA